MPFPVPDVDAGNDRTGTESLLAVNIADAVRPLPSVSMLLCFFRPSSANALPATDEDDTRDFVNLNMGKGPRFRRFFEGVAGDRQSQHTTSRVSEAVGFVQFVHVTMAVDIEDF